MDLLTDFRRRVGRLHFADHQVQAVPEVTLACADCVDPQMGAYALALSMRGFQWGRVVLFSNQRPEWMPPGVEFYPIWKLDSLNKYNTFCLHDLHQHIGSSHVLTVQADGWMLCPEYWDYRWLDWDYLGAPWLRSPYQGNSGFCLRSRKLLRSTASIYDEKIEQHRSTWGGKIYDDCFTCVQFRHEIERLGCRFASLQEAGKFAVEQRTPWTPARTFGFHDWRGHADRLPDLVWLSSHTRELGELLRFPAGVPPLGGPPAESKTA